jgi:hypothetical protein
VPELVGAVGSGVACHYAGELDLTVKASSR